MFVNRVKNLKESKNEELGNTARNRKELQSKYGYDKVIVPVCGGWKLFNSQAEANTFKNQK